MKATTAKKTTKKAAKAKGSSGLAKPGDPLVLGSGEVLLPIEHDDVLEEDKRKHKIDPVAFRGAKKHNVRDLPAPVNMFNAIGAVFAYSVMGVGDREIADALKCSVLDIEQLRAHAAYSELFEACFNGLISANSDSLVGRIASYSHGALDRVAHLSANAQNEAVMLRASTDILDRAGMRPKDVDTKGAMKLDTLRIQILDGNKELNLELGMEVSNGNRDQ